MKNPPAIKTKVVPPPSRKELIEAMVLVQLKRNQVINAATRIEREVVEEELEKSLFEAAMKQTPACASVRYHCGLQITIDCAKFASPAQKEMVKRLCGELDQRLSTDPKTIRDSIREKMDGITNPTARVATIVKDNEQEILAMLAAIFKPANQIANQ